MNNTIVRMISLSGLDVSAQNVRKTAADEQAEVELKASIRAVGVLQNLVVQPGTKRGRFEVIAGGRRLAALRALALEGVIPHDFPVPCVVDRDSKGTEISLMENSARAAMHPADAYEAYSTLQQQGLTSSEIALRHGVTERIVEQRLRLGNVHAAILAAYREGRLRQEQVQAFGCTTDQAAQLRVYNNAENPSYLPAYAIRQRLLAEKTSAGSALAQFVSLEVYREAGGTITVDLFSDENDGMIDDLGLLQRLADQKLEAEAARLRDEWAWVKIMPDLGYTTPVEFYRLPPTEQVADADMLQRITKTEQRLEALRRALEEDRDATAAEEQEYADLMEEYEQRGAAGSLPLVHSKSDRQRSGVILSINGDGSLRVIVGLVERGHSAPPEQQPKPDKIATAVDNDLSDSGDATDVGDQTDEDDGAQAAEFSQALRADLAAYRLQITQAHLAEDFGVAFDLMLYSMAESVLGRFRWGILDFHLHPQTPISSLGDIGDTKAAQKIDAARQALAVHWLGLPQHERFLALRALPQAEKERLFAFCVASGLIGHFGEGGDVVNDQVGALLTISMADYWRPTAANFWGRLKKDAAVAIGANILGEYVSARRLEKKAGIVSALEAGFDRDKQHRCIGVSDVALARAACWLPKGFAYAPLQSDDDGQMSEEGAERDTSPHGDELPEFLITYAMPLAAE
jgi:ParB family transcriptional regulator, chromosome partitioning protein